MVRVDGVGGVSRCGGERSDSYIQTETHRETVTDRGMNGLEDTGRRGVKEAGKVGCKFIGREWEYYGQWSRNSDLNNEER